MRASATTQQTKVVLVLLLLALAAVAGVWGQQQHEQEAAVDAEGMPEVAAAGGGGGGGGGLFGRMARMLDTGSAADDDGAPIDWEATKDEGEPVDPSKPWGSSGNLADAWSIDKAMQMVRRTLDGDPSGAFKDMIANTKDLQDAWANPTVFKYLFNEFPLFQAIKPVAAIGNKQTITTQDGRNAMQQFVLFVTKSMEMLDMLRDQSKLAAKMADYSNPRDPTLVQLFNLVENSKDDAAAQVNFSNLQKYIFKKELSDLLDFDMLGFNGQEPPFLDAYRNKVKKMAPGLFDNIVKDPIMRKYMDNPFAAVTEAKNIMENFKYNPVA